LSRHKKVCTGKLDVCDNSNTDKYIHPNNNINNNINNDSIGQLLGELIKNVKEQKDEIDKIKIINYKLVQDKIEMLENNEKYLKSLINDAGTLTKTSVSALAYVTKNFSNAPCLKSLKCDEYEKINMDDELVDVLICYFN